MADKPKKGDMVTFTALGHTTVTGRVAGVDGDDLKVDLPDGQTIEITTGDLEQTDAKAKGLSGGEADET